ncbi:uncharacterized protein LOC128628559 [Artibeus jamaicensis]|uniref:uncharacterized protein LOC128628559 n=1 Tax=Artibeus jamaicensis TaxID=9417 RepID=UPI00235AFA08|nr:uncharacterized protein LOC128628559 [Artibeus jamaicensis]XP_053529170.1 uncharacterized protein LOC128628559 [Artibeus jamaicensis]
MICQNHGHNQEPLRAHQPFYTSEEICLLRSLSRSRGAVVLCLCELYQAIQTFAPGLEMCAVEAAEQMQTCGLASEVLALPHQGSRLASAGKGVARAASGVTGVPPSLLGGAGGHGQAGAEERKPHSTQRLRDPKADPAGLSAARNTVGSEKGKDGPGETRQRHHLCRTLRNALLPRRRARAAQDIRCRAHFRPALPAAPGPRALAFSLIRVLHNCFIPPDFPRKIVRHFRLPPTERHREQTRSLAQPPSS